jgi:hypothetical protein
MTRQFGIVLICIIAALAAPLQARADGPPRALPQEGRPTLYQRIITRPGAKLYARPGEASGQPLAGFEVLYVFNRATGWVQVGRSAQGQPFGWVKEEATILWYHAMVVEFDKPEGRDKVVFLRDEADALTLIHDPDPAARARALAAAAQAHDPGPVVAVEPDGYADIQHRFYLMPVLHAELQDLESGSLRLVEIAAATEAPPPPPPAPRPPPHVGVMFVVDTTVSMQPAIDAVRKTIRNVVAQVRASPQAASFRFGIVTYRDSLADTPGLEYTTRVYATPDFDRPFDAVLDHIADIAEARVSSNGFDEDPVAGLKTAIEAVAWSKLDLGYLVLITDSGARPATHPHSYTHMNLSEIRDMIQAQSHLRLCIFHLLTEAGRILHDHEKAAAGYQSISSCYHSVPDGSAQVLGADADYFTDEMLRAAEAAQHNGPVDPPPLRPGADPTLAAQYTSVAEAVRMNYLGRTQDAAPPPMIIGWASDHDLTHIGESSRQALTVRVLLTRNQLSDLSDALQRAVDHVHALETTQPDNPADEFFNALQKIFGEAARGQHAVQGATTGQVLHDLLDGLPYKSSIMQMTLDRWQHIGGIEKQNIINEVESKLRLYAAFNLDNSYWHDVTHSGVESEKVFAMPLRSLP